VQKIWHQTVPFLRFYSAARTRYQVHSPFAFEWTNAVLEDDRWYYAFEDIEAVRREMLESLVVLDVEDYGAASENDTPALRQVPLRQLARTAASSPGQGRVLFRLAQWLRPERMLELGTSVGVGTMYLATAAPHARFVSLEGSETCAHVARAHLGILGLDQQVDVVSGPFRDTLAPALQRLGQVDLVFFDGHHHAAATLAYFEQCLPYAHAGTVLVFDDMYWSSEMAAAWEKIKAHPRITLTVDCFDLGFAFLNPDIGAKQHLRLVQARLKPWQKFF
jgi:predicted O-methyltransferase YrrM